MAGVADIMTYEQTQSVRACNFFFFDAVLASKGSNFSELTYISIDLKGPSFPNLFTGYKEVFSYFLFLSRLSVIFGLCDETVRELLLLAETSVRKK